MRAYLGVIPSEETERIKEVFTELYNTPPKLVSIDTETVSLKDRSVVGVGFATLDGHGFYLSIDEPEFPFHWLTIPEMTRVFHNAAFDCGKDVLYRYGVDITNLQDTALLMRLMNKPADLAVMGTETRWRPKDMGAVLKEHGAKSTLDLPPTVLAMKCLEDVLATMELYTKYRDQVFSQEYYQTEVDVQKLLLRMSWRGIKLDKPLVEAIDKELETNVKLYTSTAEARGFNPLSPRQVAITLMDQGASVPWVRSSTTGYGRPDTSEEALSLIEHPYAQLTLLARKYTKLHSTYIHPLVGQDRAYSRFTLTAATGRVASSEMNLHNIPAGRRVEDIVPRAGPIRSIFLPDSGSMTRTDMSQVELRIAAYMSGDVAMQDVLNDASRPKSDDVHGITSRRLGLDRVTAKNFNFGSIYGGTPQELARVTRIQDLGLVQRFQREWFSWYPQMERWIREQQECGLREMKVQSLYGRELSLYNTRGAMTEKHVRNMAANYPVQCSAGEIFKRAMLEIDKTCPDLILQVHDELLMEGSPKIAWKDLAWISPLWTPFEVSTKERWS